MGKLIGMLDGESDQDGEIDNVRHDYLLSWHGVLPTRLKLFRAISQVYNVLD